MADVNDLSVAELQSLIASIPPDSVCKRAELERLESLLQDKISQTPIEAV